MIKVFLSSTSKDLEPYRQRTTKAISGIDGYHCIAMENFGARDSSAEAFCPDKVEEWTILALIHRNGSRLPNRRVELYDLAAKTLLETWQIERMNAGKFNIREGEASQFLWPPVYWLHTEKPRGMATEQEIKYQLAKFLAVTHKQEPDHPRAFAKSLLPSFT